MTAAQIYTMATLLNSFDVPNSKRVNFTNWTSGKVTLRFMSGDSRIRGYRISEDGSYTEDTVED